jgi:3-hydroxyacyl-[acyl-carrier-protein] dehydratase
MTIEKQLLIDPLHPSLAGHFPGNPIVPGVVILAEVLDSIGQSLGERMIVIQVPVVKFHSPLRPNEIFDLTFNLLPEQKITFSCQVGSRRIASGQFIFQTNDQSSPSPL